MSLFVTTRHVDYLQRIQAGEEGDWLDAGAPPVDGAVRLVDRVRSAGRPARSGATTPNEPSAMGARDEAPHTPPSPADDLLIGLSGHGIPIAYRVTGGPEGVVIEIGTWTAHGQAQAQDQQEVLRSTLSGVYPGVAVESSAADSWAEEDRGRTSSQMRAGIVLGVPILRRRTGAEDLLPWDRILRAMAGASWQVLILAQPVAEGALHGLRNQLLNEIRTVAASGRAEGAPSPLADHYTKLLKARLDDVALDLATGAWRTSVYLLAEGTDYYRLASVWKGTFSDGRSRREPIKVWDHPGALAWAREWAMADSCLVEPPGKFEHPFAHQTLLTSSQVAAYVHLPSRETAGFQLRVLPDFDVVPPETGDAPTLHLGAVTQFERPTATSYDVSTEALARHALIAGVTGSGKTNTICHLLLQLWRRQVGFLVLEPAKTEYRALLEDGELRPRLRIFTPGDERTAPFRLNPLEVERGVAISTHIDLLKSVFNASFGMWTPLPQVLEQCLHAVYADFGWSILDNHNSRLPVDASDEVRAGAFPTLSDLHDKAAEVVAGLGYDAKVASDIEAALLTRLNGLRIGGKGAMLDTRQSVPVAELLDAPTVIELEPIGDDDEKAFVMGLLLIRLYEHLQVHGVAEGTTLRHVVVVEEAHRLLSHVPPSSAQDQANVKGKAVETFVNMLSEIRAYGEGFIIAEQIPSKLAPDVVKNTNVKIVHRVVAEDDRKLLRGSMNMTEEQSSMVSTLRTRAGQAVVFAEGDDRPLLISVPYAKLQVPPERRGKRRSDATVRAHMEQYLKVAARYAPFPFYPEYGDGRTAFFEDARRAVDHPDVQDRFASFVLSLVSGGAGPERSLGELIRCLRARLPQRSTGRDALRCTLLHAVRWYVAAQGRFDHWPYDVAHRLERRLAVLLVEALESSDTNGDCAGGCGWDMEALSELSAAYGEACRRTYEPFSVCAVACPSGQCLYRYQSRRLLSRASGEALRQRFDEALAGAAGAPGWDQDALEQVADQVVGPDAVPEARRSASLCYGTQRILEHPDLLDASRRAAVASLIGEREEDSRTDELSWR